MKKIAQVVKIQEETAFIKIARASACGDNCASCGSHCTDNGHIIKVKNDNYTLGQLLEIETKDKNILLYSAIAYGIPLIIMIITAVLSYNYLNIGNKEITSALTGILSLVISFYLLRYIDTHFLNENDIIEKIIPFRGE
jgi:sigma-E factor negative regulatory protein RseC